MSQNSKNSMSQNSKNSIADKFLWPVIGTVIGGLILAYLIQDARFDPARSADDQQQSANSTHNAPDSDDPTETEVPPTPTNATPTIEIIPTS